MVASRAFLMLVLLMAWWPHSACYRTTPPLLSKLFQRRQKEKQITPISTLTGIYQSEELPSLDESSKVYEGLTKINGSAEGVKVAVTCLTPQTGPDDIMNIMEGQDISNAPGFIEQVYSETIVTMTRSPGVGAPSTRKEGYLAVDLEQYQKRLLSAKKNKKIKIAKESGKKEPLTAASSTAASSIEPISKSTDVDRDKILGSGSFGQVYEGTVKVFSGTSNLAPATILAGTKYSVEQYDKKLQVAVKQFTSQAGHSFIMKFGEAPREEANILIRTQGNAYVPNFIELILSETIAKPGAITPVDTRKNAYLVMEHTHAKEAFDYVAKKMRDGELNMELITQIFLQIVRAVKALHDDGMAHCDLKLENLMWSKEQRVVKDKDGKGVKTNLWLIDLGMTKEIDSGAKLDRLEGTLFYLAPEMCRLPKPVSLAKVDIYAMGMIFYNMILGAPKAWIGLEECIEKTGKDFKCLCDGLTTAKAVYEDVKSWDKAKNVISPRKKQALELLKGMVEVNPANRLKMEDILSHPFFKEAESNPSLAQIAEYGNGFQKAQRGNSSMAVVRDISTIRRPLQRKNAFRAW